MRAILLLVAFVALSANAAAQPEPRYKGKPLAYWLERFQKAEADDEVNALCAIGPAAKDALPAIRRALLDAVSPEPAVRDVADPTLNRLHQLGPDAVPMLVDLVASETPKGTAYGISELGKLGPGA